MSRFSKYVPESDLSALKKLEPGQSFVGRLTGDHPYDTVDKKTNKPVTLPVLEFEAENPPFAWRASGWSALEEMALADPAVGDVVRVERFADRGQSHQYSVTVVQPSKPPAAEVVIDTAGLDEKYGSEAPWT